MLEKIEQLREEFIKKLDELEREVKGKVDVFPKGGDTYWAVGVGDINSHEWYGDRWDIYRKRTGNIYRTREEAETTLYNQETGLLLKELAQRLNDGVEIDWEDDKAKHYMYYSYEYNDIRTSCLTVSKSSGIYCLDRNFKNIALKEIGEERLIQYFKSL